jgi:hypothetical protein
MMQSTTIGWATLELLNEVTGQFDKKEYTLMTDKSALPFGSPKLEEKADVGVTLGGTYNMGNFNSARVTVNITVPCPVDQVEQAYNFCQSFAESKVAEYHQMLFNPYNQ